MAILPMVDSVEGSSLVAEKILASMAEPFDLDSRRYHISISIGISHYPNDGLDEESLIKHADIAMYKAKDSGRNTYQQYHHSLNDKLTGRLSLENDLRDALVNNNLTLAYQPQYELLSGKLLGVEALLHWQHPARGMVPPDDFIGLAEESGLIVDVGYWVLCAAAQQYVIWQAKNIDVGRLSINLSPHQFMQGNLVEQIESVLRETGMPASALGIEITESAAMPNFQYSIKTLEALRDMQAAIYIDDFGTGFSSLSHLRHLPIDAIKIDRQFIDRLPGNPDDAAITQAIISMSKNLNLQIIAEGVENEEQLAFLRHHGCHAAQGFALAHPMSADELALHGVTSLSFI